MVGVERFSVYVPFYRLARSEIAQAWGGRAGRGEKAVANHDEDSVTMAVAAGMNCLKGGDGQAVDGLFLASTTPPYKEKQCAALVGAALGLRNEVFTADFSGSLRAGASALRSAMDAVAAGSARKVMVASADIRTGYPNGAHEMDFGDGAASLVVGKDKVVAEIEGTYALSDEINDVWRSDKNFFVESWEERFVREKGYLRVLVEALSGLMKRMDLEAKDFSRLAAYGPNPKLLSTVAKKLGFDPATQVQDPLYETVGNAGTALAPMVLAAALEKAEPGDRILFGGYGDGGEAFALRVTDEIRGFSVKGLDEQVNVKRMINYQKYLRWRGIVPVQPPSRPPLERPSAVALWRDRRGGMGLFGVKCRNCGTIQYPAQRVCVKCQSKDRFEPYRFADKRGRLTTFSHDNLAATTDPPATVAVVDFEEGGRIMCDMTDKDPEEVKVGMPVEMTFRKVRYAGSIYDYWWKCIPVRT